LKYVRTYVKVWTWSSFSLLEAATNCAV